MTIPPVTHSAPVGTVSTVFDVMLDFPARVVTITGELDLATAPLLLGAVETLLAHPADDLIIDLAGVAFIDSVGLGAFVQINNALHGQGHRLILINPTARQRRLFMLGGLASFLATP